jgi:hypothetical protein
VWITHAMEQRVANKCIGGGTGEESRPQKGMVRRVHEERWGKAIDLTPKL